MSCRLTLAVLRFVICFSLIRGPYIEEGGAPWKREEGRSVGLWGGFDLEGLCFWRRVGVVSCVWVGWRDRWLGRGPSPFLRGVGASRFGEGGLCWVPPYLPKKGFSLLEKKFLFLLSFINY